MKDLSKSIHYVYITTKNELRIKEKEVKREDRKKKLKTDLSEIYKNSKLRKDIKKFINYVENI